MQFQALPEHLKLERVFKQAAAEQQSEILFVVRGGCKTLRTDTAAHCKRKGVREEDWAALDLKTLLSGQEGPGIDASAILIRHQRRLTAERRS